MGSYFRGRPVTWDPDAQSIKQERQRWVYERIGTTNDLITELTVDPDREYEVQRQAWVETGDMLHLRRMLEYVRG
jgi:hypothetical protein